MTLIALQIEQGATRLLDYGLAGIGLMAMGFLVWYLLKKSDENSKEWKEESKKMSGNFVTLVTEQNLTNQRLIDIRERDVVQHKEFYNELKKEIGEIPRKTISELNYKQMNEFKGNNRNTSAG